MISPANIWMKLKDGIFKAYAKDPGKMLLHTGAIGWILSSAAQIVAIGVNKKYTPEQKMFLIPQELGDGAVNILSFYTLTYGVKYIGKLLTKSGKICSKDLAAALKEKGYVLQKGAKRNPQKTYVGDWNFNIEKLPEYKDSFEKLYKPFNNGSEVIAGLFGSILSSNLITPVIRNSYASKRQKDGIEHYNKKNTVYEPKQKSCNINRITLNDFKNKASSKIYTNKGSLKI